MKKEILKYVSENDGVSLVDIYDTFRDRINGKEICFFVTALCDDGDIELITDVGYVKTMGI